MRAAFRGNHMLKLGILILLPFAVCALVPGLLAPHSPDATLGPPLQPPSREFLLGTDEIGRDLLSRIIYAARVDLGVCVSATVLSTLVGSSVGLFAGYRGRAWDTSVMRSTDVLLAFPSILLAIFVVTILGRTEPVLIVALAILFVPGFVRLARGLAVSTRERAFVSASEISGGRSLHVIRRHILPNASGPLLVGVSLTAATSLLVEAGLSYLGLGLPPPTPSWGNMLQASFEWLFQAPLYGIFPGLCITLVALGFTWVAEGVRSIGQPAGRGATMRLPVTLSLQAGPARDQTAPE